jgi:hypothetical protein
MESRRFDALARRLSQSGSRRGLLGAGLAVLTTRASLAAAKVDPAARCSRNKPCPVCFACHKHKCHVAADGAPCADGACQAGQCVCTPDCNRKICGDDSCGGSCGDCPTGHLCTANGTCVDQCPSGQRFCQGSCIPGTHCCTDDECDGNQTCCQGSCIPGTHCCADDDCDGDQTCCPDGRCANLQTDAVNCGACGATCPVNETCSAGTCRCGAGPSAAPDTCCDGGSWCGVGDNFFDPVTCEFFPLCANSATLCVGSAGEACQTCCPAGTRCELLSGICRQQPSADRATRRGRRGGNDRHRAAPTGGRHR